MKQLEYIHFLPSLGIVKGLIIYICIYTQALDNDYIYI